MKGKRIAIIDDTASRETLREALAQADVLIVESEPQTEFVFEAPKPLPELRTEKYKKSRSDPTHPKNAFRRR